MKPLIILSLLITGCTTKPSKQVIEIPIGTADTFPTNKKATYNIQKSPGEKHVFEVNTRNSDSVIVKNYSK